MNKQTLVNRDLSWLSFNRRVLEEAASETVPLLERIKFLSIFSSNLDEFYRVKVPALLALQAIKKKKEGTYKAVSEMILKQQKRFGHILDNMIIPQLAQHKVYFLNTEPIPAKLAEKVRDIFYHEVAGLLQPVYLNNIGSFFPENNQLYALVILENEQKKEELAIVNFPTKVLPRFYTIQDGPSTYIFFIDDIILNNIQAIFPKEKISGFYNIKITRDAELTLTDDYDADLAQKIEKQLLKRDLGLATRFLYQPGIPLRHWKQIKEKLNIQDASMVKGGVHHGLKDLSSFPFSESSLLFPKWLPAKQSFGSTTLFGEMDKHDLMVHTPYQCYSTVIRFFNEAVIDPDVTEIYTTLYRVASDSRIAHALISAARIGKKVSVLVELKARFDEANNLRWAKRMKEAGVKIIYSSNNIKVHAKVALLCRKDTKRPYLGLLATGNLNENTARYYTDHILLTAHTILLNELKMLFDFLVKKQKPEKADHLKFEHLLVAQFNLLERFIYLIDREIAHAQKGRKASITLKLNNLEEETLIMKLYEASAAGVKIELIVRGICCLKPGVKGLSDHIRVKRIVDRYLEHGRIYIFGNNGKQDIYLGSADWMSRNIYRRIEVCFPVYAAPLKQQLNDMIQLQLKDNIQAVWIDENSENKPIVKKGNLIRSQESIYQYLNSHIQE